MGILLVVNSVASVMNLATALITFNTLNIDTMSKEKTDS